MTNPQEMKPFLDEVMRAFPDHHIVIGELIAEGDKVAVHFTESGTMKGSLMGMEATGKQFTVPAIEIYRFANGKITEMWVARDTASIMKQLGVAPPPGQHEE